MPAAPNVADSAMAKQPACAAAINSSGLVPAPDAKRELNEYSVFFSAPPGAVSEPLPSFSEPCQTALAERFMVPPAKPARAPKQTRRRARFDSRFHHEATHPRRAPA